jgi:5-(carboxyamino)imidazole ribonucleotide synthase
MLSLAAARLGLKTHIYSDEADAPAFQVSAVHTHASYENHTTLERFARSCQAVTFEFENVPAESLAIVSRFAPTNPCVRALQVTQDRLEEKRFVASLGLRTPRFAPVHDETSTHAAMERLAGRHAILKTRRLGYDGKGQARITNEHEVSEALRKFQDAPSILEEFIPFAFEASVVAARAADGQFAAYDPPENLHGEHILRRSTVPSRLTPAQCREAIDLTRKIAEGLEFVGVLAVELFVGQDGSLLVNEIAPRVHNSGHWTLEACALSQFEQHIRAIAGWPLGDPARHSNAVMENIIGDEAREWQRFAREPGALHLYGKPEVRKGRKMGHFTRLSPRSS